MRYFNSQDEALAGIMLGKVKKGDVVVIRYEGPRGGPGMPEMLANVSNCWHGIRCRCCAINGWSFLWCFTWYFGRAYFTRSSCGRDDCTSEQGISFVSMLRKGC